MEAYNGFYNWKYTTSKKDIPNKVLVQLDRVREPLVAACWVDQFMKKGESFVVVTSKRVLAKSGYATLEVPLSDVQSIERSTNGDVVLNVSQGKRAVFSVTHMPVVDLIDRVTRVITEMWNSQKG